MSDENLRKAYERWAKRQRPQYAEKPAIWFERDTVWGEDGYMQPCVHFEWLAFKAGAKYRRRSATR